MQEQDSQSIFIGQERQSLLRHMRTLDNSRAESLQNISGAVRGIKDIFAAHNLSFGTLADHPEWLMGQVSEMQVKELQLRVDDVLAANRGFEGQSAAIAGENDRIAGDIEAARSASAAAMQTTAEMEEELHGYESGQMKMRLFMQEAVLFAATIAIYSLIAMLALASVDLVTSPARGTRDSDLDEAVSGDLRTFFDAVQDPESREKQLYMAVQKVERYKQDAAKTCKLNYDTTYNPSAMLMAHWRRGSCSEVSLPKTEDFLSKHGGLKAGEAPSP